jgi:hypothetical protein
MNSKLVLLLGGTVCLAVAGSVACGGGSPVVPPTPGPTTTPTPTPTPPMAAVCPDPTPPPLRYVHVSVQNDSGYRKILDSKPQVLNVDGYCGKVGFYARAPFCDTRQEGDPDREACDAQAMGRAVDTGRYGPTWYYEGSLCAAGPDQAGCSNHQTNQFLAIAKGPGEYMACASPNVPLDPEGEHCGLCIIRAGASACNE